MSAQRYAGCVIWYRSNYDGEMSIGPAFASREAGERFVREANAKNKANPPPSDSMVYGSTLELRPITVYTDYPLPEDWRRWREEDEALAKKRAELEAKLKKIQQQIDGLP